MNTKLSRFKESLLVALIILGGCNQRSTTVPSLSPKASPSLTESLVAEVTNAPSPTSLATLSPEAAQQEITRLMQTNDDCPGACFWGIVPGVTSFDQAVGFLRTLRDTRLTENKEGVVQYIDSYQYDEEKIYVDIAFSNIGGAVNDLDVSVYGMDRIDISTEEWIAFRPDNLLKAKGVPDKVYIVMVEGPEGRLSYGFYLIYGRGYIEYSGNQVIIKPEHILTACPLTEHAIDGLRIKTIPEYDKSFYMRGVYELGRINGMSSEEFYRILTGDAAKACFSLDYDIYLSLK